MTDGDLLETVKNAYWLLMDHGLLKGTAEGERLRHRMSEAMQELLRRRDRPVEPTEGTTGYCAGDVDVFALDGPTQYKPPRETR